MERNRFSREILAKFAINPNIRVPKHEQVKQFLLEYIKQMPEEEKYLPIQRVIAESLNLAGVTVRHAFEELREQGIIEITRRSGSRVINRNIPSEIFETQQRFLEGVNIAVVFATYADDKLNDIPEWLARNCLEKLVLKSGGRLICYNSAEEKWRNPAEILEEFNKKGIKWVFLAHNRFSDPRGYIKKMIENNIKPVLFNVPISQIVPGADWIALACEEPLCAVLEEYLDQNKADFIAYISGTSDLVFARTRMDSLKKVAEQKGVMFKEVIEEGHRGEAGYSGARRVLDEARKYKAPLLIGANDYVAVGILKALRAAGIVIPDSISVIGFDNIEELRHENLSTFDRDPAEVAEALFSFCKEFYAKVCLDRESRGRIVFSKFIPRGTTKFVYAK